MSRSEQNFQKKQCWLDVFESSDFEGKMRRYFGPTRLRTLCAGSAIVGPGAVVHLLGRRRGRPITIQLPPKRLIPNLAAALRGFVAKRVCICPPAQLRPGAKKTAASGG